MQQLQATGCAFCAFAALADGSVVTWGNRDGGDSSQVQDQLRAVKQIQATKHGAFAAILRDRSVVTWGKPNCGGDSSAVLQFKFS